MAQIVRGDREVFSHMLFGGPDPYLQQYIQETNNHFSTMLTSVGQQFVQNAQNIFSRIESNEALRLARAAMRKVNTYLQEDVIYQMTTIDELQEAPNIMVQWIMTHPQLRQLHKDEVIDAYGNRYIDVQPGAYKWNHQDYCTVYGGWMEQRTEIITKDDGTQTEEHFVEYVTPLEDESDVEVLLDEEAVMIHQAHVLVDRALAEKRDPTSYYDNILV